MLQKLLLSLLFLSTMVALAIWSTWPLATHFRVAIPTSEGHLGTVPLLNAWSIWWNADSLAHGLKAYWDAPIFFPTKGAFAFSEPQPATLILAPFVWSSHAPITAYNLYLFGSIVLNGWFARRLLSQLHCTQLTSFCGGVAVALHPLAWQNLEAIQLLPMWGVLWTMTNLIQLLHKPTWQTAVWTGLAFASTATTSIHHTLFLALILVFALPLTIAAQVRLPKSRKHQPSRRAPAVVARWKQATCAFLLAAVTACCLLLPLLGPMEAIHRQHKMERSGDLVAALSATVESWTTIPANSLLRTLPFLPASALSQFPEPLLPGLISPLLVLSGFVFRGRRRPIARLASLFLLAMAVVSFSLSFGPGLGWNDWNIWMWMRQWFPPLGRIRSPYRFAYFTQLSVILFACLNLDLGCRQLKAYSLQWRSQAVGLAASAALFCVACENIPGQVRLVFPPLIFGTSVFDGEHQSWMSFVSSYETATALLCLPIATSDAESNQEQEAVWMACATQHRVPLLNGYSGFTPSAWQELSNQIRREGLNDHVLDAIQATGANLIVVQRDRFQMPRNPRLNLVFDRGRVQVWQLPTP